jgi:hypothetical protein
MLASWKLLKYLLWQFQRQIKVSTDYWHINYAMSLKRAQCMTMIVMCALPD